MLPIYDKSQASSEGLVLSITLSGAVSTLYHDQLNMIHCNFVSSINWNDKNLCAAVHILPLDIAQFILSNKDKFNLDDVLVVADADTSVFEIELLDGNRVDPLEFLSLFVNAEQPIVDDVDDSEDPMSDPSDEE